MGANHTFPTHWAITPRALSDLWRRFEASDGLGPAEPPAQASRRGATAIIPIIGSLAKDGDWFGPGMRDIGALVEVAAADPKIRSILLHINSPGGTVDGTLELAEAVKAAAAIKPVVAYNDGLMASAAYWIGSQATRIVAAPMGEVGSIGTLMVHADYSVQLEQDGIHVEILRATGSPDKAKPNMVEPLDEDARADVTAVLDEFNTRFHDAVRAARPKVSDKALTGKVYTAESAPTGLIDQIGTFKAAIEVASLLGSTAAVVKTKAASQQPNPQPQLTQPLVSMSDIISNVAAIYEGNDFEAQAIKLAARGSSVNEIAVAYGKFIESKLADTVEATSALIDELAADHESAVAAIEEANTAATTALKDGYAAEIAELQARVDAAEKRAEEAQAKYQARGFRPAEHGDSDTPKSTVRIIHYGD